MDCANIVKRGYLFDKKIGIIPVAVDRKRWYILRRDLAQGYCVLEYYKDEKAAAKGDPPKGFINVHDVVAVQRVPEKKQSFEILCPGVGYRLMANSDVEANEWTETMRKLILYRKDNTTSLTLRTPSSPPHAANTLEVRHERQRTLSDSSMSFHHTPSHPPHPKSLTIPTPARPHPKSLTIPTPSHHHTTDSTFPHSHSPATVNLSHSLPTPPDMAMSPPVLQYYPPIMQRQKSNEFVISYPSPSTSSDSSSMCSGSNASFDTQAVFDGDGSDTWSRFRVHVKEADNLSVSGPADLVVSEEGISLLSIQTGQEIVSWPIGSLRRYGVNNVCFTILTGRFCSTGEGRFQFYTPHCRLINTKVHNMAMVKAGGNKSMPRRSSEPTHLSEMTSRSPQASQLFPNTSLPPHMISMSPPSTGPPSTGQQQYSHTQHSVGGTQHPISLSPPSGGQRYSHIQHSVVAPSVLPHEQYGKLHSTGGSVGGSVGCYPAQQLHSSNSLLSLQSCTQSAMVVPISNPAHNSNNNCTSPEHVPSIQEGKPPSSNDIMSKSSQMQSRNASSARNQFQILQSNV